MESLEGEVIELAPATVYIIKTRVCNIEHRSERLHVSGFGGDATFRTVPIGWFVHFEGSWEAIYLGQEKPDLQSGDAITIKISKDPDAKPNTTPIKQVRQAPPPR